MDSEGIWRALAEVKDPEYPISVVDLGLIYGVQIDGGRVRVEITFTATGCPCMDWITEDIRRRLLLEEGVEAVDIAVTWSPPWTANRLSPRAGELLSRWGISR